MNNLPLPDELIRRVYSFIHPAFCYARYVKNIRGYRDSMYELEYECQLYQNNLLSSSIQSRKDNIMCMGSYVELQSAYLEDIEAFLEKNPAFVRPGDQGSLTEYQYKLSIDYRITKYNRDRLEKNLTLRRGLWCDGNYDEGLVEENEIMAFAPLTEILQRGSTRDLIYACIINRVRGFKNAMTKYMRDRGLIWTYDENNIVEFINHCYPTRGGPLPALRKRLVRKLMKI